MTGDPIDKDKMCFGHLTDLEMACMVRSLFRTDLGHEGVVTGARDRIMWLSQENARLTALLEQPMSEQDARFAIDGAIAWGYEGTHKPPTDDHWLMPYWVIGRKLANDVPVSWQLVPKEPDTKMMEAALVIGRKWAKFQYLENDGETEDFAKAVALDIVTGYRAMLDVAPTLVIAESEG